MSSTEWTDSAGRVHHECDECDGSGVLDGDVCPECDGLGEWFE
jgi:DnaJ-class molecular chaperone